MASVLGAGTAALRRVISLPVARKQRLGQARGNGAKPGRLPGALNSLVEGEIIPRLLMAHSAAMPLPPAQGGAAIEPAEAVRFASLPLMLEADELLREVEQFLERGVSVELVFVDLLAPSARRLGQLWDEDACDFVDVTMGLWRLQEVLREVALRSTPLLSRIGAPPHVLFSPYPGEQHSFGSLMLEEYFARAGWQSEVLIEPKRKELLELLATKPFDLVGLTISCDCPSGQLSDFLTAIRGISANSAVRIIVGGRMINANPGLAEEIGADGTAADARGALVLAEKLVVAARPVAALAR